MSKDKEYNSRLSQVRSTSNIRSYKKVQIKHNPIGQLSNSISVPQLSKIDETLMARKEPKNEQEVYDHNYAKDQQQSPKAKNPHKSE